MVSSSFSWAAAPREELLRLVPDSVGFCFVVQDLRGHVAALQNSPFLEQLRHGSLADKIRNSDDGKKLSRFESKMKEKLGLDWAQLRDDIFGDAVVLAYQPGPPGKPDQEQGVLLFRARNAKVLANLIERVNKVEKEDGELKDLAERRHQGRVYYRRLEYDKRTQRDKPPMFYYVHGPIVALSSQESMIRQLIDCDRSRSPDAVPEATRRLRDLDADRALLALWINPRAFDAELDAKTGKTTVERSATVKHFAQYWKALDSVVLSLTPEEREIKLALGVRARVAELPPAAQRLFRESATASDVWKRFPESALLAAGGRLDGATLLDVLGGFLNAESRQTLHVALNRKLGALLGEDDFARDVLPALGPDWGLCITAPPPGGKNWMPQTIFALRVAARTKKPVERKLLGALDFAARLIIFAHNNQESEAPWSLKSGDVEGQEVRYLSGQNSLPAGLQPAYGMLHGYLILSSSLEGLTRFAQAAPASSPPPPPDGKIRSEGVSEPPVPLLRISVRDWRAYLRDRREPIVQFLADTHKLPRALAEQQLEGLLAGLQFIERIELRQRVAPGRVLFTFSVQTAQALKK